MHGSWLRCYIILNFALAIQVSKLMQIVERNIISKFGIDTTDKGYLRVKVLAKNKACINYLFIA